MELTHLDVAVLNELRARFLNGSNIGGGYWRSESEVALYDRTFGERIGWKWDAVLSELEVRKWMPKVRCVCDFGCGSGVAGRRVLRDWPWVDSLLLWDVSELAMNFAMAKAREFFPAIAVNVLEERLPSGTLLVVSHVMNELVGDALERLLLLAKEAEAVLWVEAGSRIESRALGEVRKALRGELRVVGPCTHSQDCGMFSGENERHWCHSFARVASEVFQDAGWARFGRELGIDITTLPYCYLAMERGVEAGGGESGDILRIIGRPREAKGRMELLCCRAEGVGEFTLQKRDEPELFKSLQKGRAGALQQLSVRGGKLYERGVE